MTQLPSRSIEERRKIIEDIKYDLSDLLGDVVMSATIYGSTLDVTFSESSDFDILLVLKNAGIKELAILSKIVRKFELRKVVIDFSIHKNEELPSFRGEAFWHNNRSSYFRKELSIYGEQLIGDYLFEPTEVTSEQIALDAVRMINSFTYQTRTMLVKNNLPLHYKPIIIKRCIYASMYALAAKGVYPKDVASGIDKVSEMYETSVDAREFFDLRKKNKEDISEEDLINAYGFLSELDKFVYADYKKKYSA